MTMKIKSLKKMRLLREAVSNMEKLEKLEEKKQKNMKDLKIALLVKLMWEEAGKDGEVKSCKFVPYKNSVLFMITGENGDEIHIKPKDVYRPVGEKYSHQIGQLSSNMFFEKSVLKNLKDAPNETNKNDLRMEMG